VLRGLSFYGTNRILSLWDSTLKQLNKLKLCRWMLLFGIGLQLLNAADLKVWKETMQTEDLEKITYRYNPDSIFRKQTGIKEIHQDHIFFENGSCALDAEAKLVHVPGWGERYYRLEFFNEDFLEKIGHPLLSNEPVCIRKRSGRFVPLYTTIHQFFNEKIKKLEEMKSTQTGPRKKKSAEQEEINELNRQKLLLSQHDNFLCHTALGFLASENKLVILSQNVEKTACRLVVMQLSNDLFVYLLKPENEYRCGRDRCCLTMFGCLCCWLFSQVIF
jgi:hypothetical protein